MSQGVRTPKSLHLDIAGGRARLLRLARRAGLVLLWERIWPPLAWGLTVLAVFLAASWFGLWIELPAAGRIAGLALFALALLGVLYPLTRLRAPRRDQSLARLDRDAGIAHQPATSSLDRLAISAGNATTRALWDLHQRRLAANIAAIEVAPPAPRMVDRDVAALRFAAVLLAVCAAFVAGAERYARLAAAFDWRSEAAIAQGYRLDAWIDPPTYTGKPPIMLDARARDLQKITAPVGSILVVRANDDSISARTEGALAPVPPAKTTSPAASGGMERRWTVKGPGLLRIARGGAAMSAFQIAAVPNQKPTIALSARPQANLRGSLTLSYKLADQYGVASAEADFARPLIDGAPVKGRSLTPPPKMTLQLPGGANGVGDAQTTADLSEHPWAGAQTTMTLRARNLAGEEGASAPIELTLPQRRFENPLARALVEQRRDLVLDPDETRGRVAVALDALMIAPDVFGTPPGVYLGLLSAKDRLQAARSDADLIGVADFLWAMALQIEDGDASQAERDLRAAEQKLREALERGASDAEIRELTKELRAAAERFTRELGEQGRNPPDSDNAENMTSRDLDKLLDQMEQTARTGDRQQAQAMLDQLQNMFENMKSARRGSSPAARELRRQLGELDKLMRDQQALRDDTFRRDQREQRLHIGPDGLEQPELGEPGEDQNAERGEDSDRDPTPLDERQKGLGDRLGALQQYMKGLGLKPEKGFDAARGDMGEAEGDLQPGGKGKGEAVGAQGRALEALREGAQGLQKQLQGQGQQEGEGEGVSPREMPGEAGRDGRDPLGRDRNGFKGAADGRLNGGPGAAQRAQRVLEELRRRLADPNRSAEERSYLERLLNRD